MLIFFFFSSRRRHTRCLSDWSSDVCSSDLWTVVLEGPSTVHSSGEKAAFVVMPRSRSEERRVGKECRSRWSPYHEKKKKHHLTGRRLSQAADLPIPAMRAAPGRHQQFF